MTVNISGAIKEACAEFGESDVAERKRAIIVFFANEDPSLGAHLHSLKTALGAAKARLFVVVIQRVPEREASRGSSWASYPFPVMAAQFLSQLAAGSGGRIYRQNWDLKGILTEASKP